MVRSWVVCFSAGALWAARFKEVRGWKEAEPRDQIAKGDWYSIFGDPSLNKLEIEATMANQNLKAAMERVEEARAAARQSAAQFYPNLTVDLFRSTENFPK